MQNYLECGTFERIQLFYSFKITTKKYFKFLVLDK